HFKPIPRYEKIIIIIFISYLRPSASLHRGVIERNSSPFNTGAPIPHVLTGLRSASLKLSTSTDVKGAFSFQGIQDCAVTVFIKSLGCDSLSQALSAGEALWCIKSFQLTLPLCILLKNILT
ncbi:MAG: hypothetical protein ACTILG_10605, partial [Sphingobacterium sp.]